MLEMFAEPLCDWHVTDGGEELETNSKVVTKRKSQRKTGYRRACEQSCADNSVNRFVSTIGSDQTQWNCNSEGNNLDIEHDEQRARN